MCVELLSRSVARMAPRADRPDLQLPVALWAQERADLVLHWSALLVLQYPLLGVVYHLRGVDSIGSDDE